MLRVARRGGWHERRLAKEASQLVQPHNELLQLGLRQRAKNSLEEVSLLLTLRDLLPKPRGNLGARFEQISPVARIIEFFDRLHPCTLLLPNLGLVCADEKHAHCARRKLTLAKPMLVCAVRKLTW